MNTLKICFATLFIVAIVTMGCSEKKVESKAPAMPPDQVVLKFYSLLAQGGKLTLKEAHQMLTDRFGPVDPNSFRKWVQEFEKGTKIKILETQTPKEKTKGGFFLAIVKMEVATPSIFGEPFISTSQMNLVLDEKTNEWKIDFLAQTIDYENEFKKAPVEAKM